MPNVAFHSDLFNISFFNLHFLSNFYNFLRHCKCYSCVFVYVYICVCAWCVRLSVCVCVSVFAMCKCMADKRHLHI